MFRKLLNSRRNSSHGKHRPRALRYEALERREMLTTFNVTNTNDSGAGSLRDAIEDANAAAGADKIVFAAALSGKRIEIDSSLPQITDDLKILNKNQKNVIVDGQDIAGVRPFNIDFAVKATLKKLTITGGNIDGFVDGSNDGGGVVNQGGTLTLDSCLVTRNRTDAGGDDGGGIDCDNGSVTTIKNSTISRNRSFDAGGGIHVLDATLNVLASKVKKNTMDNLIGGGIGGGIAIGGAAAIVAIQDSSIEGNESSHGGGIRTATGSLTVERTTISGNHATSSSGGVVVLSGAAEFFNCTIANNSADGSGGGGMRQTNGTLDVVNCTIVGNTDASDNAEGAGGISKTAGTLNLRNSIVAGNSAGPSSADDNVDAADLNENVNNLIGAEPGVGPLANNGGPTRTMLPLDGSPVIDAGSNTAANDAGLTIDQRGLTRIVDGTVDIGAVETQAGEPLLLQELQAPVSAKRAAGGASNSFDRDQAFAAVEMQTSKRKLVQCAADEVFALWGLAD